MKEKTYKTLAKIGSFLTIWYILSELYNLYISFGFNIIKLFLFFKDEGIFLTLTYFSFIISLFIFVTLPLWYFGWKKN